MRKIIGLLVIVTIAAMIATNVIAAEDTPATDADTAATEEVTTDTNNMYIPGEAYAGILYTQSDHNLSGTRVVGDSGIGVKGGYFVADNADISFSYVAGTWTIGTLSAGASEIRLMGNYHYPFVHSSSITLGGLIGVGHPVGATGARLIITMINELKRRGKKFGCASLCASGGPGHAFIVEAL